MTRRRLVRSAILGAALISVASGGYWIFDHRSYWLCANVREVEPGQIYAGAYQYPIPLERIINRYQIKTVLSLREGNDEHEELEQKVLESKGVQFKRVVIPYGRDSQNRIAHIEEAIQVLSDEQNHPVFVHCWAGCHRTGAVVAIYRVSRCRWTEQAAFEEMVKWGGNARGSQWPTRILHTYCSAADNSLANQPNQPTQVK